MRKKNAEPRVIPAPPAAAEIAALAHSFWEAEGCPEGADFRHWLRAEAELTAAAEAKTERGK